MIARILPNVNRCEEKRENRSQRFSIELSFAFEKVPEQGRAYVFPHAGEDGGPVPVVLAEEVDDAAAGAGHAVSRAEDEHGDAGIDDRAGTHRAGLERDEHRAALQPPVPGFPGHPA